MITGRRHLNQEFSPPNARIVNGDHDNEERAGRLPRRTQGPLRTRSSEHIEVALDQRGRQVREPLCSPLGRAVLHDEVLALYVPQLPQVGLERLDKGRSAGLARVQHTDADNLPRPLRVHIERHGENAQGTGEDGHDSAEPHDGLLKSVQVSLMFPHPLSRVAALPPCAELETVPTK